MIWLLLIPFGVQTVCMGFDEFYYHHRRGLPRWERIGHPLDTITVLACYGWIAFVPPSNASAIAVFVALAAFSSVFITKDELVHARECGPGEQLTHSLLFVFHAWVLAAAGFIWPVFHRSFEGHLPWWLSTTGPLDAGVLKIVLIVHMAGTAAFLMYQIIYWNLIWTPSTRDPA